MQSRALLLRGYQGVGKTTVAERIAEGYGFCRVSKDAFYVPIMERYGNHRSASDIAYMGLRSVLRASPSSGINFVVDAPFNGPVGAPALMAEMREWGFVAKSALLVCSDHEEWARRLGERGSAINHLVTSLEEIRGFRGTLDSVPFEGELVLDTATSVATIGAVAAQCVEYLRQDTE